MVATKLQRRVHRGVIVALAVVALVGASAVAPGLDRPELTDPPAEEAALEPISHSGAGAAPVAIPLVPAARRAQQAAPTPEPEVVAPPTPAEPPAPEATGVAPDQPADGLDTAPPGRTEEPAATGAADDTAPANRTEQRAATAPADDTEERPDPEQALDTTPDLAAAAVADSETVSAGTGRSSQQVGRRDGAVEVEITVSALPDDPAVAASHATETVEIAEVVPTDDPWYPVRECESHNNYSTNTGNGFYGAYQFTVRTWDWVAGAIGRRDLVGVRPDLAAPQYQDRVATALAFEVPGGGLHHWPLCGRLYGR